MDRPTRQELEDENEHLRSQLEVAQKAISQALGYDDADDDYGGEDDEDDDELDEDQ